MNRRIVTLVILITCYGCSTAQDQGLLSPAAFAQKATQLKDAVVLDVRTPDEYRSGHMIKAKNIDWSGNDFEKQVALLDKTKPVLLYCQRGGRSESAAKKLRGLGFKEVYDLDGGLSAWQAARLPVTRE